eukprot:scaffold27557_cov101-Isochrysis_galbana.AAC.2
MAGVCGSLACVVSGGAGRCACARVIPGRATLAVDRLDCRSHCMRGPVVACRRRAPQTRASCPPSPAPPARCSSPCCCAGAPAPPRSPPWSRP